MKTGKVEWLILRGERPNSAAKGKRANQRERIARPRTRGRSSWPSPLARNLQGLPKGFPGGALESLEDSCLFEGAR